MLIELSILLAASTCQPHSSTADSYTICAEKVERSSSQTKSKNRGNAPKAKPMRLCSYYLNNSIDSPTEGVITAWVPVGARSCIGDAPPEPKLAPKTSVVDSSSVLQDSLTSFSNRPFASWVPGDELEIFEFGQFNVEVNNRTTTGHLLGQTAQIRFIANSTSWQFSDSITLSGRSVSKSFQALGSFFAVAKVTYRVDYRMLGQNWVTNAATVSLASNQLEIEVTEPPRRTLLIL
jgi:hypothetical protein